MASHTVPGNRIRGFSGPRILSFEYHANVTAFTGHASVAYIHNHAETLAAELAANCNVSGYPTDFFHLFGILI